MCGAIHPTNKTNLVLCYPVVFFFFKCKADIPVDLFESMQRVFDVQITVYHANDVVDITFVEHKLSDQFD